MQNNRGKEIYSIEMERHAGKAALMKQTSGDAHRQARAEAAERALRIGGRAPMPPPSLPAHPTRVAS